MIFDGGRLAAAQIHGITLNPQEHDEVRVLPLAEWEALMPRRHVRHQKREDRV